MDLSPPEDFCIYGYGGGRSGWAGTNLCKWEVSVLFGLLYFSLRLLEHNMEQEEEDLYFLSQRKRGVP